METAIATKPKYISVGQAMQTHTAELELKVCSLIVEIGQYSGMEVKKEDAKIAAKFYLRDLETDFADKIDTTEVRKVFYAGVRGQFGDYYGLNAKTFYKWTNAYIKAGMSERTKRLMQERADDYARKDEANRQRRIAEIKAQAPAPEMSIEELANKMNINNQN